MIGLNINGQGLSAENALADALATGAKTHVVINESKLSAVLLGAGLQVIHRMKANEGIEDDDYAYRKHDAVAFVDALHARAPAGAWLYLGNEMGSDDLDAQCVWMQRAIARCAALGRKPVAFNNFVFHPVSGQAGWQKLRPAVRDAVQAGGRVGVHVYFDRQPERSAGAYDVLFHLWNTCGQDVPVSVTEYACAVGYDAHRGPHDAQAGYADARAYADAQAAGVRLVLGRHPAARIDWQTFIYGRWDRTPSFDVAGWREYFPAIAAHNATLPKAPARPVPPPPPAPPAEPVRPVGRLQPGIVAGTLGQWANLRAQPSTSAEDIGDIVAGDALEYRAPQDGWISVRHKGRDGWVSAGVVTLRPATTDAPAARVDVPFRSQLGPTANAYNNDCGAACALMLLCFAMRRAGLMEPAALTVDDVARKTRLPSNGDRPLSLEDVSRTLLGLGVANEVRRPLDVAALRQEIDARRPALALVQYKHLAEGNASMGHYVIVHGYGERGFWLHDPYTAGANAYVPTDALTRAMTDMGGIAAWSWNGIVLK